MLRGGHNFSKIRAAGKEVLSHRGKTDFLLALNGDTFRKHQKSLSEKGLIIYNCDEITVIKGGIGIPIKSITQKAGGKPIMENVALVAGFAKIIGINFKILERVIKEEFKKSQEVNLKIATEAYKQTQAITKIEKLKQKKRHYLLTGNEAIALGAVKAGLDFYLAYPMTPATGILHYLGIIIWEGEAILTPILTTHLGHTLPIPSVVSLLLMTPEGSASEPRALRISCRLKEPPRQPIYKRKS